MHIHMANLQTRVANLENLSTQKKKCYRCGTRFTVKQMKQCRAINAKYSNYEKIGHFAKVCQQKEINNIEKMSTIPVKRKEIPTS